jgi:hypothetical protein
VRGRKLAGCVGGIAWRGDGLALAADTPFV